MKDLDCENKDLLQYFEGEKLSELKKAFVRYSTEEILRRLINEGESLSQDDTKMKSIIFKDHENWVQKVWRRRQNQIEN